MIFTSPTRFVRPVALTNVALAPGEVVDRNLIPDFDYGVFHEGAWDESGAHRYYQTFTAKGTSITHVGFRLVHDGVEGMGPGGQSVLISVHRKGDDTPDTWEQIGPTGRVAFVDCGGAKDYSYSVGWNSGEVPTVPGETYAVCLRPEEEGRSFQAFWHPDDDKSAECFRIAGETKEWTGADLWMAVSSDCDGLLIPYNKRIHRDFVEFGDYGPKWTQTYVAQGKGLALALLYAAVDGRQPGIPRQRAIIRVREGGPAGPQVGIEKTAIGNGVYTGDASWGCFAAAFAPGEVPLTPGKTYGIEFEIHECYYTLHGFVNIKGQVSTGVAGYTPYRKVSPEIHEPGTAYLVSDPERAVDYDLDMQIIEYRYDAGDDYSLACEEENLLENGDMQAGEFDPERPEAGGPEGWERFAIDTGTSYWYVPDGPEQTNRVCRVIGGGINGQSVDGGYVQRVDGLSPLETYRVSGEVRSNQAVSEKYACYIGYDPTGQTEDPEADSIVWSEAYPANHGFFETILSEPIRPTGQSISVWLRGWTPATEGPTFEADFDNFTLRRVIIEPPMEDQ
jgi:hypothetical protein